ncbi:MAG: VWA domain-containing protein [Dethiobacter sp.]|jgi:uncharacterized protein with von Willebrand factor type A (vWA) domain|nr:VWA domain-containing protein [Dethiobacter sp.]
MDNYLEINVVRFIHLLRHVGLRIGSGEVIDALNALTLLDLADRGAVKAGLKATLVKRPGEAASFDKAFNLFFAPPEQKEDTSTRYQQKKEAHHQMLETAGQELNFQGMPLQLSDKEKTVYASIPEDDRQKLQEYIKKTAEGKNVEQNFRPLLESVVKGSLSYWRKALRNEIDLSAPPKTGDQELDAMVEGVGSSGEGGVGTLLEEDMQNIADKDLPRARALIRKLARQMVARITRRYRQSKKHKQLDLRKSIRYNLSFGGAMFRLRYRSRRIQKPKLILLCDVSGSMARYVSFVLQFIYGIHSVVGSIQSFVFSEDLEKVTGYFHTGADFNSTMLELVNSSAEWGRGTNLAASLRTLREKFGSVLTGDSYIIIVSDTKTMSLDEAVNELTELKRRVKDVVWLNTMAESDWENSKTVEAFLKIVRMYPCNTLSDLERVMRKKILA